MFVNCTIHEKYLKPFMKQNTLFSASSSIMENGENGNEENGKLLFALKIVITLD